MDSLVLIPGLPNHLASLCLLKVPRIYHSSLASVCTSWRNMVRCPRFYTERRRLGLSDAWLVLLSADLLSSPSLLYSAYDLSTKQLLFKIKFPPTSVVPSHRRSDLNCLDHYRIVAMNEYFAALGFSRDGVCRPAKCRFTIYNTINDQWRHGASISVCRRMFACGVIDGRLYVAGGFDDNGMMERSTEVYDFLTDKWGKAATLPMEVEFIQADVVFQRKLYLQCTCGGAAQADESKSVFWVYDPERDDWKQDPGMSSAGGNGRLPARHLFATDDFMYAMGAQDEVWRFEASSGKWTAVGSCSRECTLPDRAGNMPSSSKLPPGLTLSVNSHKSQRAFGYGNDIFFLNEADQSLCKLRGDASTKCHRLFSGKTSWYHAGAVVQA